MGMTIAITRSPMRTAVWACVPIWSTNPATSIPGRYGGDNVLARSASSMSPIRSNTSAGLTVAACTLMRT